MTNQPTEIAIVGVGMVGGALALGLAQHGFTVTVMSTQNLHRLSLIANRMCGSRQSARLRYHCLKG